MSDKLVEMISLRCKYCNAAIEVTDPKATIVKCGSCGTEQKIFEAKEYMNHIESIIHEWLGAAVPTQYIQPTEGEQIDRTARYSIFVNTIKPKLDTEYGDYQFHSTSFFANTLIVPPFFIGQPLYKNDEPQDVFLFNAKIKSIAPLAVDEEHQSYLKEIDSISTSYAYLLNNIPFLIDNTPDRFECMSNNFKKASNQLADIENYGPLAQRFLGLHYICLASDCYMSGRLNDAKRFISEGMTKLRYSSNEISSDLNLASMSQAVKKELVVGEITKYMIEAAANIGGGIQKMEKFVNFIQQLKEYSHGPWGGYFTSYEEYKTIFSWIEKISLAKSGESSIKITGDGGDYLFPFWIINIPYTFETGKLWMKKNPEVQEMMLISALFPTDNNLLFNNYAPAVTDIFAHRNSEGFFKDMLKSVGGKETSISAGGLIKDIVTSSTKSSASGNIVPPISTPEQTLHMADLYIDETKKYNSFIQKKFNFSQPRVEDLLFVYGDIEDGLIKLNIDMGNLCPKNIGNPAIIEKIYI